MKHDTKSTTTHSATGSASTEKNETHSLTLAAEAAEAEAEAAEAAAEAARARARAVALRQQAETGGNGPTSKAAAESTEASGSRSDETDPVDHAHNDDAVGTGGAEEGEDTVGAERSAPTGDSSTTPSLDPTHIRDGSITFDDDADTQPSRPPRWRRLGSRRLQSSRRKAAAIAVAAVLICASLSLCGYSVWNHYQLTEKQQREAEFAAAARQGVLALTSLDHSRAEQDVQRVLDNSTGAFHDDFQSRSEDFTNVVQQSQVATAGKVNATAVESMTDDSAVVLVAATSEVTNSAGAQEEPRSWRLSVTVAQVEDQLEMSKVEFVP